MMGNKDLLKQFLIGVMAFFIMFLPRRFYLVGVFSYRVVILYVFSFCLLLNKGKLSVSTKILSIPMIAYFVLTMMISFYYLQYATGIGYLIETVMVLLLMYNLLNTEQDFHTFINVFLLFLTIYTILGILECFTGFNIWNFVTSSELQRFRFSLYRSFGSSTNFTNNAAFLMLCFPIVGWKLQQEENHKRKYAVLYGLVLLNLLLTLTRSIILCTMILHFIWLVKLGLFKLVKKHLVPILIGIVVIALVVNIPAISNVLKQFFDMFIAIVDDEKANEISSSFGSNASGFGQRLLLYSWIYSEIKNNIIFGLGPNHMFEYMWTTKTGKDMVKNSIENQYLIQLYRYGIIGLISYLLMVINIICRLWKNKNNSLDGTRKKLTFGFMIVTTVIIYFVSGLFYAASDDFRMLFLLLSIFFIYCQHFKSRESVN